MIVLDANVVIAVLTSADVHHDRATALLIDHADESFAIHPVTLAEVLVGGARIGRLRELQLAIERLRIDPAPPDAGEPALVAELRAGTALKLPDCYVLAASLRLGASVATFDERLARAAVARGVALVDRVSG